MENGRKFCLNRDYIEPFKEDIIKFLDGEDYMNNIAFAKKMMMSQEIKSNNTIEGINDDLTIIDEVIKCKSSLSMRERKRIINLYHGYQYILTNDKIDKEHLRELYSILSDDILDSYDKTYMGEYYRTKPVYILKGSRLDTDPYLGMPHDKLDYFMDMFFSYVNDNEVDSQIDVFIKSQIMHFYFVYIHPYFDVNGRTSRTVSMWYLLNNNSYPYIIFNRAIAFSQKGYESNIIKARESGDVTLFLKYMLINVLRELEKEYVIHNIQENSKYKLSKEDCQMLEYLLEVKNNLTLKDLATVYNHYNEHKNINVIVNEKILPLLDKKIILDKGYTKNNISCNMSNMWIAVNSDMIDVREEKIKYLKLERFK